MAGLAEEAKELRTRVADIDYQAFRRKMFLLNEETCGGLPLEKIK